MDETIDHRDITPLTKLVNIDVAPINPNWEFILRVLFTDHCKVHNLS